MVKRFWLALLLLPVLAGGAGAQAFSEAQRQEIVAILRDALKRDPGILRDAMTALRDDDARQQEEAGRAAVARVRARLVFPGDPVAGNPFGDVTLVVFYDTRCPYCRRMMPAMAELLHTDPGVKLIYKDLPILGPASVLESRALMAAQKQGGYFRLQSEVMGNATPGTRDSLRADADRIGLNGNALLRDMDDPGIKARMETNLALAHELGLQGTPGIIAGGQLVPGALEIGDLRQLVADVRAGK